MKGNLFHDDMSVTFIHLC